MTSGAKRSKSRSKAPSKEVHDFGVLQHILCMKDDSERDKYILVNKSKVIPIFRFVTKVFCDDERIHFAENEEHSLYLEFICHISSAAISVTDSTKSSNSSGTVNNDEWKIVDKDLCRVFAEDLKLVSILHKLASQGSHSEYFKSLCLSSFANFSLHTEFVDKITRQKNFAEDLTKLFEFFVDHSKSTPKLKYYLSAYFTNLTHSKKVRKLLIKDKHLFSLLNVFETETDTRVRQSLVKTLRNCFFDETAHSELFSEENDQLIVKLVHCLAGPEEFDDEDNASLPVDLQYLPPDKERESDSKVRQLILEALLQCCATTYGRGILRKLNIYLILREYHKWESEKAVKLALENLIDILIKTEDELENIDNLKDVEVPEDITVQFIEEDKQIVEGDEQIVEVDKPVVQEEKPIIELIDISDDDDQMIEEDKQMVEEDNQMAEEDNQMAEEDNEIVAEIDKQMIEEDKQIIKEGKPMVEEQKPMVEEDKEIAEGDMPMAEKDNQIVEEDKPMIEDPQGRPMIEEDKPMVEKDKPMVEDPQEKPMIEDDKPMVEEDKQMIEADMQIVEEDKQMADDDKQLIEDVKQVVEEVKQIVETIDLI